MAVSYFIDYVLPAFVYFIIFIKIIFLIATISQAYLTKVNPNSTYKKYNKQTLYLKEQTEFVFIACISLLLIFIFNPWYNNEKYLNGEIRLLFYLFGWILIFTADWGVFLKESLWYRQLVSYIK